MKSKTLKIFSVFLILITVLYAAPISASAAGSGSVAGQVNITSGVLNVRASASTTSTIVTTLQKGTYINLLSKSGNWWQVEYAKGKYGYVSASYVTQVSGSYAAYATGSLTVRSGADKSYSAIGWLSSGDYVTVLSATGSWKKIVFEGKRVGYASASYLKTGTTGSSSSGSSSSTYKSVSLTVPSYKQTDSRWSGTKVGSSGSTIGVIGCSTVALAMTESFRTGTTIDPNAMTAKLSYTSGGAVYWPSNYTAYTNSDYLKIVYEKLASGKPVLVGLKNSSGSQHWVVVTGFTGGSSLTSSGFTINDPGSNTRTTLAQTISAYPNFYKVMYY